GFQDLDPAEAAKGQPLVPLRRPEAHHDALRLRRAALRAALRGPGGLADAEVPVSAMKQTTKALLGLAVLVVVAGAIGRVALRTGKDEERKPGAREKRENSVDSERAKVKGLRLSKDGQLAARLTKADKSWKMVQPVQSDGDDTAVDNLLAALIGLKQKKDLA